MRTRAVTRTRKIPHTIDGDTQMIDEKYTVEIPAPPRDWDQIILTTAITVIALVLGVVIVWSTASIGDLLTRTEVTDTIAYAAATAFSLGWTVAMAFEWLNRYDTTRIKRPRTAGHVFLTADMAAVCLHGYLADSLEVGITGAVVSGGAKYLWTIALDHHAAPLDDRTQQWVQSKRAESGARLALVGVRRQLIRLDSQAAAEEAALRTRPDADPDSPDPSADDPDSDPTQSGPFKLIALTSKDAVRTAWDSGIRDEDAIRRTASNALGRPISPDTVKRYVRALKVGA